MTRRWSQIIQSDSTCATAARMLQSLGRFMAAVMVARLAGVEGLALFALTVAVEAIVIGSLNAWFAVPQIVLAPGRRASMRAAIHRFGEQAQSYVAVAMAVVLLGVGLVSGVDIELAIAFALHLIAASVFQVRCAVRFAEFRARSILTPELLIAVGGVAGPMLASTLELSVVTSFWAVQLALQAIGALMLRNRRRGEAIDARLVRAARRSVLFHGSRMFVGSLGNAAGFRAPVLIVAALLGPVATAHFGLARTFAAPIRMGLGTLNNTMIPRLAAGRRGSERMAWWTRNRRRIVAAAILASAFGLGIIHRSAPTLIELGFGAEFNGAAPIVTLVCLQYLLSAVSGLLGARLMVAGRTGTAATWRWIAAATGAAFIVLGSHFGGLLLVAVAMVVNELLTLTFFLYSSREPAARSPVEHSGSAGFGGKTNRRALPFFKNIRTNTLGVVK